MKKTIISTIISMCAITGAIVYAHCSKNQMRRYITVFKATENIPADTELTADNVWTVFTPVNIPRDKYQIGMFVVDNPAEIAYCIGHETWRTIKAGSVLRYMDIS